MNVNDPHKRFSSRVEQYARYRPGYPADIPKLLLEELSLPAGVLTVADIGSGTGLLSEVFLNSGHRVIGVEPNDPMRDTSIELLRNESEFRALAGSAEATGLESSSVDLLVCGQAFHWFDQRKCAAEFCRIGRGRTPVALIWNKRLARDERSGFETAYDAIVEEFRIPERHVAHQALDDSDFASFFPTAFAKIELDNHQSLNLDGLVGRLESASYMPQQGDPEFELMRERCQEFFERFSLEGSVTLRYRTLIVCGQLR